MLITAKYLLKGDIGLNINKLHGVSLLKDKVDEWESQSTGERLRQKL